MQRLEVSGAVRPIYGPLGVKRLRRAINCLFVLGQELKSSDGMATRLRAGTPTNRGSIPGSGNIFYSSSNCPAGSGTHQLLIQYVPGVALEKERPIGEAEH